MERRTLAKTLAAGLLPWLVSAAACPLPAADVQMSEIRAKMPDIAQARKAADLIARAEKAFARYLATCTAADTLTPDARIEYALDEPGVRAVHIHRCDQLDQLCKQVCNVPVGERTYAVACAHNARAKPGSRMRACSNRAFAATRFFSPVMFVNGRTAIEARGGGSRFDDAGAAVTFSGSGV